MPSSTRTLTTPRLELVSLMLPLPLRRLREILSHVVPESTLESIAELPSTQLARLYGLGMSDGRELTLSSGPSLAVRLLRHEVGMLSSEAALLYFITGTDRATNSGSLEVQAAGRSPHPSQLCRLIPKLLKHSSNSKEMAYPYSIFEVTTGAPLSTLSIYLSRPERHLVDKQIGSLARGLASLVSPSGRFGPVSWVLPDPLTAASSTAADGTNGAATWSRAFSLVLEGVLRDGEDMDVSLPYGVIRTHCERLSGCLDAVTVPRLAVFNAGSETNVMIERGSGDGTATDDPQLTGLRSWSQGFFGDPLVSSCFEDASEGFLEGWHDGGEDLIEDAEHANARLLLYKCLRAAVGIVTEYCRPHVGSSRKELEGRRRLTSALAELDDVNIT